MYMCSAKYPVEPPKPHESVFTDADSALLPRLPHACRTDKPLARPFMTMMQSQVQTLL